MAGAPVVGWVWPSVWRAGAGARRRQTRRAGEKRFDECAACHSVERRRQQCRPRGLRRHLHPQRPGEASGFPLFARPLKRSGIALVGGDARQFSVGDPQNAWCRPTACPMPAWRMRSAAGAPNHPHRLSARGNQVIGGAQRQTRSPAPSAPSSPDHPPGAVGYFTLGI